MTVSEFDDIFYENKRQLINGINASSGLLLDMAIEYYLNMDSALVWNNWSKDLFQN